MSSDVKSAGPVTRPILKRPLPRRRGHKHRPGSPWFKRRSLYAEARDEISSAYQTAHHDRERAEVVATKESVLLDLDRGEVKPVTWKYLAGYFDAIGNLDPSL